MPHLQVEVEDGKGNWRQEDGGASLLEVQRDGSVQLRSSAATGVRHIQELRGPVACGFHGRQWCSHVGQGDLLRAQGRGCRWWQEEVSTTATVLLVVSPNLLQVCTADRE